MHSPSSEKPKSLMNMRLRLLVIFDEYVAAFDVKEGVL
jgi:hypothetical protein